VRRFLSTFSRSGTASVRDVSPDGARAAVGVGAAGRWLARACLGAMCVAALAHTAAGEVYFSDASVEISGTTGRGSRTCAAVLKPTQTLGGDLAPRLVMVTEGETRLSFGIEKPAQYSGAAIVQANTRRPFVGFDNAAIGQFRLSEIAKVVRSQRLFFVTARLSDGTKYVSSRYDPIDFDAILAKLGANCPFDAESLMADLSRREREERALGISAPDLTLIRWALNKRYAGAPLKPEPRPSLAPLERTYLKTYARDNGLALSQYLTTQTARRLISDGQLLADEETREKALAAQEQRTYNSARGNLGLLRAYVNTCRLCAFKSAALDEIKTREEQAAADRERGTYERARGNLDRLRGYLRECRICSFEAAARTEIEDLENPKVTFRVKSNHPNAVGVAFYSADNRTRAWPGGDQHYVIKDWDVHDYVLKCEHGEKICYGAWVEGRKLSPYWGSGLRGRQNCVGCCFTCPANNTPVITLEPSAATQPPPTMSWRIRKQFPVNLGISFYSQTRQGFSWPGGGRGYLLNDDSERTYNLNCMAGEKICYGAWIDGAEHGVYWGAGPYGRYSCPNCCGTCDGGEYTATLTGR
jgi:hypothetical protein